MFVESFSIQCFSVQNNTRYKIFDQNLSKYKQSLKWQMKMKQKNIVGKPAMSELG